MNSSIETRERRYGLNPGDIDRLDHGACWICGGRPGEGARRLAVDHDHATTVVRGFLCSRCNSVLGLMQDSPELLRQAAQYLDTAFEHYRSWCLKCVADLNDQYSKSPIRVIATEGHDMQYDYECAEHPTARWSVWRRAGGFPMAYELGATSA